MPLPGADTDYNSQISDLLMWRRMHENKLFNNGVCVKETDVEETLSFLPTSKCSTFRNRRDRTRDNLSQAYAQRQAAQIMSMNFKNTDSSRRNDDGVETEDDSLDIYPTRNVWKPRVELPTEYRAVKMPPGAEPRQLLRRPLMKTSVKPSPIPARLSAVDRSSASSPGDRSLNSSISIFSPQPSASPISQRVGSHRNTSSAVTRERIDSAASCSTNLPGNLAGTPERIESPWSWNTTPLGTCVSTDTTIDRWRRWSFLTFDDPNPFSKDSYYATHYPLLMHQIEKRKFTSPDDLTDEEYNIYQKTPNISLTMFDTLPRLSSTFSDIMDLEGQEGPDHTLSSVQSELGCSIVRVSQSDSRLNLRSVDSFHPHE